VSVTEMQQAALDWRQFTVPDDLAGVLSRAPAVRVVSSSADLVALSGSMDHHTEVAYDVPGRGRVVEAWAARVRNGVAANYVEPYLRRRDPDCLVVGDGRPTDKERFEDRFGRPFAPVREETFDWLADQRLVMFFFDAGIHEAGIPAVVVAPENAGFFALGLALLQGIVDPCELPEGVPPRSVLYVAPPFRHTHFDGRQVVVHNRVDGLHELFSYNLYPGPSAKKGIYGVLISIGELEGWVTAHCATVKVVTPYDQNVVIMHEGASGSGKSEMLEYPHRQSDGTLLLGRNVLTGDERHLTLPRTCLLEPVTDDMALCHPTLQDRRASNRKLRLTDAEAAWFVRVNQITRYGTDPHLERVTIEPDEPLLFLNIDAVPGSTALIWEHIEDEPGVRCPNPRVVLPRSTVPNVVSGAVSVDIRSFGVRTPPCTAMQPTYGIVGLFQILPPALAWLWRLVAPRGHENPSIVDQGGMTSEGVGSYWPFSAGRRIDQANLLLRQIQETPGVSYILVPNQHIGAWNVGFMGQWLAREYLARRGSAHFDADYTEPARCPLLGWALNMITIEGQQIGPWLLKPHTQAEVGEDAYDAGAEILRSFFADQLALFDIDDLDPMGHEIIDCFQGNGTVHDYHTLMPIHIPS
jgi:hypothetical protein